MVCSWAIGMVCSKGRVVANRTVVSDKISMMQRKFEETQRAMIGESERV